MGFIIEFFKNFGLGKIITILIGFFAITILVIYLGLRYSEPEFLILYSNLDIEESNKIVASLDQQNIPYKLKAQGTQILVPEDRVLKLRMSLAQDGLPNKGSIVGYEIFDKTDTLSTSNFVQNVYLLRALEGELGRTISSFHNVKKARVHLVIPKRELFSRELQQPSASVVLDMKGGVTLSKEEVNAISHLVSTSVAGLDLSKITIVDTRGKSLKISENPDDALSGIANSSVEYKNALEFKLKKTIEDMLEKTLGTGSAEAQVTAEINFDRVVTNSEVFDPSGQVVRSTQTIEEKESSKESSGAQDASVASNLPNAAPANGSDNNSAIQKTDETVNYEISKTVKNQVSETGTIKKLSIAVVVDGIYNIDPTTKIMQYSPRSAEDLKRIEKLIKSAVGFSDERKDVIEVVNLQFNRDNSADVPESMLDWIKTQLDSQLYGIIKNIIFVILILVVLLKFVKPFINRIFDAANEILKAQVDAEVAIAQAEVENNNIKAQLERESRAVEMVSESDSIKLKKNNAFQSINEIVEQCPEETVMILRNWLNNPAKSQ